MTATTVPDTVTFYDADGFLQSRVLCYLGFNGRVVQAFQRYLGRDDDGEPDWETIAVVDHTGAVTRQDPAPAFEAVALVEVEPDECRECGFDADECECF